MLDGLDKFVVSDTGTAVVEWGLTPDKSFVCGAYVKT